MKPSGAQRAVPRVGALGRALAAVALVSAVLAAAGCGPGGQERPVELQVFAASSLTEAFDELAGAFEREFVDVDVRLNTSGSQFLRLQIEQGADADVFASANEAHAMALAEAGLAEEPRTLAWNALVVIVPSDNPAGIGSLLELTRAERLVIGSPEVPVGAYTRTLFARAAETYGDPIVAEIRSRVVSEESNVRLVRAKVELGEADAAIVYRTDAIASDRVTAIGLPPSLSVRARYVISAVGPDRAGEPVSDSLPSPAAGTSAEAARLFIEYALSPTGVAILERHGFEGPDR